VSKIIQYNFLQWFRTTAWIEGVSYLLLGFTMILKYKYEMPLPNYIVGMAHGFLFMAYVILLVIVHFKYQWSWQKSFLAFVASLVPFGTFWADHKLFNPSK
jgi:integral membrane protein